MLGHGAALGQARCTVVVRVCTPGSTGVFGRGTCGIAGGSCALRCCRRGSASVGTWHCCGLAFAGRTRRFRRLCRGFCALRLISGAFRGCCYIFGFYLSFGPGRGRYGRLKQQVLLFAHALLSSPLPCGPGPEGTHRLLSAGVLHRSTAHHRGQRSFASKDGASSSTNRRCQYGANRQRFGTAHRHPSAHVRGFAAQRVSGKAPR